MSSTPHSWKWGCRCAARAAGLLALSTGAASCLAAPAAMTNDDAQFLFVLGRMSPAAQMAVLNVANECQLPPTKATAQHLSHSEVFPRLLRAHMTAAAPGEDALRRAIVRPDSADHAIAAAPADSDGRVSFPRSLCDELASLASGASSVTPA